MKVQVKLYASLGQYLPDGAVNSQAEVEAADGATPTDLIRQLGVPPEHCHLVLIDGTYIVPSERDTRPLKDGEALAIWPPVAGG